MALAKLEGQVDELGQPPKPGDVAAGKPTTPVARILAAKALMGREAALELQLQQAVLQTEEDRARRALHQVNLAGGPSEVKAAEYRLGRILAQQTELGIAGGPLDDLPMPDRNAKGLRVGENGAPLEQTLPGAPKVTIGPLDSLGLMNPKIFMLPNVGPVPVAGGGGALAAVL